MARAPKRRKDRFLIEGQWFSIPRHFSMRLGCCDCGLVHRMFARVTKQGHVLACTQRDEKATTRVRKRYAKHFVMKDRR